MLTNSTDLLIGDLTFHNPKCNQLMPVLFLVPSPNPGGQAQTLILLENDDLKRQERQKKKSGGRVGDGEGQSVHTYICLSFPRGFLKDLYGYSMKSVGINKLYAIQPQNACCFSSFLALFFF